MPSLATLVNLDERALHRLHTGLGTYPRHGDRVVIDIEAELVEPPEPEAEQLQQARARGRMRGGEPIAADGRTFQLGEGWHSSKNTVHFWNP